MDEATMTSATPTRSQRLVILAVEWYDHGEGCWASVPTLAASAGVSERTVQRAIADGERCGWLSVTRRPMPGRSLTNVLAVNRDRLHPQFWTDPAPARPAKSVARERGEVDAVIQAPTPAQAQAQAKTARPEYVPTAPLLSAFRGHHWSALDLSAACAFSAAHGEEACERVAAHVTARWSEYVELSANLLGDGAPRLKNVTPSVVFSVTSAHFARDAARGTVTPPPAWVREVSSLHFMRYGLRGAGQLSSDAALGAHLSESYPAMTDASKSRMLRCVRLRDESLSAARAQKSAASRSHASRRASASAVGSPEELRSVMASLPSAAEWKPRDRTSAARLIEEFGWSSVLSAVRHASANWHAYSGRSRAPLTPSSLLAVKSQVFPDAQLGRAPSASARSRVERSEYRPTTDTAAALSWNVG